LWRFFAEPRNKEEFEILDWSHRESQGILLDLKDGLAVDHLKVTHPSRFARAFTQLKEELAARGLNDYSTLMLESVSSHALSTLKSSSFSTSECTDIRERVLNVVREVYFRDFYYHYIYPDFIQIVDHDHSVRLSELHFMHNRNEIKDMEGSDEGKEC
jgi:hypothetical protein